MLQQLKMCSAGLIREGEGREEVEEVKERLFLYLRLLQDRR